MRRWSARGRRQALSSRRRQAADPTTVQSVKSSVERCLEHRDLGRRYRTSDADTTPHPLRPASIPIETAARLCLISSDFVPWRFSDAGLQSVARSSLAGVRETCTGAGIVERAVSILNYGSSLAG